ncbi:hypothetical protein GGF43_001871 [Coemansia sp. RSA 2618]|nr:hypothetical protein GGF43_001871 [Coemansia sp. RSA 2618]
MVLPPARGTAVLVLALIGSARALSNSDMQRPEGADQLLAPPPSATEEHVVFGQEVSMTSSSAGSGWSFESAGNSWHVWTHESIFDRVDLPLWPEAMKEARIILSSAMCRTDSNRLLPPFVPPRELEHCGSHMLATAHSDIPQGAPTAVARAQMRLWVSQFMDWSDSAHTGDTHAAALGPDAFISLGNSSIYHFIPFSARSLGLRRDSRLDLMAQAVGPHHYLRELITPKVMHQGKRWLDNYRIEVQLQRTTHGFVRARVQAISVLPAASEVSIEPLDNASSRIAWIGPTKDAASFMLATNQSMPEALHIPDEFFARSPEQYAGDVSVQTADFSSFHPSLLVSTDAHAQSLRRASACRLNTLLVLPRTYFFDPYQLRQQHDDGLLKVDYQHYGQTELERPAEAVPTWGSVLVLSQADQASQLNLTVPIHARYRLPPVHEQTVGFHGEPTGETHVDLTLPPPISAIVCPTDDLPSAANNNAILANLHVRLALFDELGLTPVGTLQLAPDADTLLRMPVPGTDHASLVQACTLGLLFAGALFIIYSARKQAHV